MFAPELILVPANRERRESSVSPAGTKLWLRNDEIRRLATEKAADRKRNQQAEIFTSKELPVLHSTTGRMLLRGAEHTVRLDRIRWLEVVHRLGLVGRCGRGLV